MEGRRPVILISGTPRVGKTRLARKLVELTAFDVIHCDEFRKNFYSIIDAPTRDAERFRHYDEVVAQRRNGLILEGDDLICRNRGDRKLARQRLIIDDNRLCLSLLLHLKTRFDAKAFIAGFTEPDLDAVVEANRHHGSRRLRNLPEAELRSYVLESAQRSRQLKSMADEAGVPFVELAGDDPDSVIEATARRILREVDWPAPAV